MLGINLVLHAIKILFHDIWATVRITVLPMIVGYGIAFAIIYLLAGESFLAVMQVSSNPAAMPDASFFLAIFIAIVALLLSFCWAAVGWHRFVLLEENPGALLPNFRGSSIKSYLWAGVRIILVSLCLLMPIVLILPALLGAGALLVLVLTIVFIAIYVVILRYSLVLPGAAIDQPMSLGQSWNATKDQSVTLLVVAVSLGVIGYLAELSLVLGYLGWIIWIFLSWLSFALGISILTTLYGVYVEKREL